MQINGAFGGYNWDDIQDWAECRRWKTTSSVDEKTDRDGIKSDNPSAMTGP